MWSGSKQVRRSKTPRLELSRGRGRGSGIDDEITSDTVGSFSHSERAERVRESITTPIANAGKKVKNCLRQIAGLGNTEDSTNRYGSSDANTPSSRSSRSASGSGSRQTRREINISSYDRSARNDPLVDRDEQLARKMQAEEDNKRYESGSESVRSPARRRKREKEPPQNASSNNDNSKRQKRSRAEESNSKGYLQNLNGTTKNSMTRTNTVDLCDSDDETDNSDNEWAPTSSPKRKASARASASAKNGSSKSSKGQNHPRNKQEEEEEDGQYDDADEQKSQKYRRKQKQKRRQPPEDRNRKPEVDLTTQSRQEEHNGNISNRREEEDDDEQNHKSSRNGRRMIDNNPWEQEKSTSSKTPSLSSSSTLASASASKAPPVAGRRRSNDQIASKEQMKKATSGYQHEQRESAASAAGSSASPRTKHADDDDDVDFCGSLYGCQEEEEKEVIGYDSSFGNEDEEVDSDKAVIGLDKFDNDSPKEKESSRGRGRYGSDQTNSKSVAEPPTKRSKDVNGRRLHSGGFLGNESRIRTKTTSQKLGGMKIDVPPLKGSQMYGDEARSTGPSKRAPKPTSIANAEKIDSSDRHATNIKSSKTSNEDATDDMEHPTMNEDTKKCPPANLFGSRYQENDTIRRSQRTGNDDNGGSTLRLRKQNYGGTSASAFSGNKTKKARGTPIVVGAAINANARENGYRQTREMKNKPESTSGENSKLLSGNDSEFASKSRIEKESSWSAAYDRDDDFSTTNDDLTYVGRRQDPRRSKASAAQSDNSDSEDDFVTTNDDMTFRRRHRRSLRSSGSTAPPAPNGSNDDFDTAKDDTSRSLRSNGSRRTRSASRKKLSPEIVEIDSTDSEAENDEEIESKINLKRLSWRREGQDNWTIDVKECLVSFNEETNEITLHSRKIKNGSVTFSLELHCNRVSHFGAEDLQIIANDGQPNPDKQDREFDHQGKLFIELSHIPSNFQDIESSPERKHGTDESTLSIVLDFVEEQDHDSLVESINPRIDSKPELTETVVEFLNQTNRKTRQKKTFGHKRDKEDIILVYPFHGHRKYALDETFAEDLTKEFQLVDHQSVGAVPVLDQPRQRAHHLVVRMKDFNRLKGRKWLNDTLVDFYMQWLTRQNEDIENSDVHIFTSHFYSTLRDEGTNSVQSWTEKKNINIFKKKLVFIPINESSHWSLCVLVNPGKVEGSGTKPESKYPCMLFMDSLRMHDSNDIKKNIYSWLNKEWNRLKSGDTSIEASSSDKRKVFRPKSFPCHSPEVPRQRNGCDCGVFVCRYAYGVYKLADLSLTRAAVMSDDGVPFRDLIHRDQGLFDFDSDTIKKMRADFMTLLGRLSGKYDEYLGSKESLKQEKKKQAIDPQKDTTAEDLNGNPKTDLEDSGRVAMAAPTGSKTASSSALPNSLVHDTSDIASEKRFKNDSPQYDAGESLEQDMDTLQEELVDCSLTNGCKNSPLSAEI
mmetsp:Transcript_2711/g.5860  ORF Transcript_2711/g.5860 Transcript_2711/m.5860 type:complete len:1453 (-) Transcript_2711:112-4470(-)